MNSGNSVLSSTENKVCHKNTWFLRGARNMGQGSGLNFKDVVRHPYTARYTGCVRDQQ